MKRIAIFTLLISPVAFGQAPQQPSPSGVLPQHQALGYFLETKSSMKGAMGTVNSVRVMGYNVEDKVYTYNIYNSLGEHQEALGHLNGITSVSYTHLTLPTICSV